MEDNKESIGLGDFKKEIMDKYLQEVKKELIEKDKQIEKNIWNDFKEEYAILFAKLKYLLLTLHEADKDLIDMMMELDNAASKLKGEEEPKKGKKDTKEQETKKSNADLTKEFLQKIDELGNKLKGIALQASPQQTEETAFMHEIDNELTELKKQRKTIEDKMDVIKKLKIGSSIKIKNTEEEPGEDVVLFFDEGESYVVKKDNKLKKVEIAEKTITINKGGETIKKGDLKIIKDWMKSVIKQEKEKEKENEGEPGKDEEGNPAFAKKTTSPPPKNEEGEGDLRATIPKKATKSEKNEAGNTKKTTPHPPGGNPDPLMAAKEIEVAIKQRDDKIKTVNEGREDIRKLKPINFDNFLTKISDNDIPKLSEEIREEMNKIDQNMLGGIADSTIKGYNERIDDINNVIGKLGDEDTSDVLKKVSELLNTYSSPEPPSKTDED